MTTVITNEKKRGLEALADSQGVIAALAIDQRGALRSLFAKAMGAEPARLPAEPLVTFKEAASRILTPHASAILLDPEYGLPAAKQRANPQGYCWPTSKPATTNKCGDACRDCCRDGRLSAWWKPEQTA
jgi:tagatose-1,6-bisphosphate aldolase